MNVKAVVKVMNFHALLRVEASGRQAVKYNTMEEELSAMMSILQNNQNLRLDKRIHLPDMSLPVLRIYLGSDLGFCGSVNTSVSAVLQHDPADTEKIVIGRKLRRPPNVHVYFMQEEFRNNFELLRGYLEQAVRKRPWSAVEIVYNHYYNVSSVKQEVKRIYPLEVRQKPIDLSHEWDDFEIEGDAQELLEDMMISCLVYEVRIAAASAYAAENIMRQNATSESLKKLDELETEAVRAERKERNQASFRKTIDSFIKQKSLRR